MIADELCKIVQNTCNKTEKVELSLRSPYSEQESIYKNVIEPMINLTALAAKSLEKDVDKQIDEELAKLEKVNPSLSLYSTTEIEIQKKFLDSKGRFDWSKLRGEREHPKPIELSGQPISKFLDKCISGIEPLPEKPQKSSFVRNKDGSTSDPYEDYDDNYY